MRLLIDGYNLLHAVGWAPYAGSSITLERSRIKLLDWLANQHGKTVGDVTLVFDAQKGASESPPTLHKGITVRYAFRATADDAIEELLKTDPKPKDLTVVSNDHRLQQAAQRRGAVYWECGVYVDWLASLKEPEPRRLKEVDNPDRDKPNQASQAELDEWLRVFEKKR